MSHALSILGTSKWAGATEVRSFLTSFMVLFK